MMRWYFLIIAKEILLKQPLNLKKYVYILNTFIWASVLSTFLHEAGKWGARHNLRRKCFVHASPWSTTPAILMTDSGSKHWNSKCLTLLVLWCYQPSKHTAYVNTWHYTYFHSLYRITESRKFKKTSPTLFLRSVWETICEEPVTQNSI